MKTKWIALLVLPVLLLSFMTACQDKKPKDGKTGEQVGQQENQQPAVSTPTQKITAQEAENIALTHAGLTREQVQYLHTDEDRDDGVPEYDVQFVYERLEYEYEIHAETGKILSFDKDYDD